MSSLLQKTTSFPTWKEEVNRRVAAHLSRKTAPIEEAESLIQSRPTAAGRAARAAARVAARFANAPSYNELLADEARMVVRAAQAASRAAQEAQAAAQCVLDGLEATPPEESVPPVQPQAAREPITKRRRTPAAAKPAPNASETHYFAESPLFGNHWEPLAEPVDIAGELSAATRDVDPGFTYQPADEFGEGAVYDVEPAQPIHANLIEFPRLMVAARRVRPRLAEGPLAQAESAPQLSIFEVDPGTVSSEPGPALADELAAPEWMRPQWPEIEADARAYEKMLEEPEPGVAAFAMEPAPMSRRLMATMVDCALIGAAFLSVFMLALCTASELPGPRSVEWGSIVALLVVAAVYLASFLIFGGVTPGMMYAGTRLSTVAGLGPSRAQRVARTLMLPLSILPLGLGMAWALFDDGHLAWHDRLSGTYLRRR